MLRLEQCVRMREMEGEEAREMNRGWASHEASRSRFYSRMMGAMGVF